jgi:hypothetical protein
VVELGNYNSIFRKKSGLGGSVSDKVIDTS